MTSYKSVLLYMVYSVIYSPRAEKEILEAYSWYEKQLPGLGKRFYKLMNEGIGAICLAPENYSFGKRPYRQHKLPDFPYLIIFRIAAKEKTVFISSVFHTSRNPRRKFKNK